MPLPFNEPTVSFILGFCNIGVDPADLEAAIDDEIAKVRNELISEREFQKLRNQFENQIIQENVWIEERAHNLATLYTYFGDATLINKTLDRYMSVTREDIQRVAQKYLVPENRVVLYYLPRQN